MMVGVICISLEMDCLRYNDEEFGSRLGNERVFCLL